MNLHICLLAILVIGISMSAVFAFSISVKTDMNSYSLGDKIEVFGEVTSIIEDTPVTIQILHDNNLIDIVQAYPSYVDGTYTHTFDVDGPLWEEYGTYIVRAFYGTTTIETSFEFIPETSEPVSKIPEWVRNIFIWYAEKQISEDELLNAIQFLLDQGILKTK